MLVVVDIISGTPRNIPCRDRNFIRLRSDSRTICLIWIALGNGYHSWKHIWTRINILAMDSSVPLSLWDNYWANSRSNNGQYYLYQYQHLEFKLDSTLFHAAPNQYFYEISSHFQSLYPVIIEGSLVFHLVYGSL